MTAPTSGDGAEATNRPQDGDSGPGDAAYGPGAVVPAEVPVPADVRAPGDHAPGNDTLDDTAAPRAEPVTPDFDPFRFGRPEPGSPAAAAFPHLFPPQPDAGTGYPPPGAGYPPPGAGVPPPGASYPPPGAGPGYPPPGAGYPPAGGPGYPPPGGPSYPPPGAGLGYPPPQPGTGLGYPPPQPGPGLGYPPGNGQGYAGAPGNGYPAVARPGNGKAVAGFVLGIASVILFFFTALDLIPIVLAYVFSTQGLHATKRGKGQRGLAVAGIVLASIAVVLVVAFGAFLAVRINHCQQHHDQGTKAYNQCVIDF